MEHPVEWGDRTGMTFQMGTAEKNSERRRKKDRTRLAYVTDFFRLLFCLHR